MHITIVLLLGSACQPLPGGTPRGPATTDATGGDAGGGVHLTPGGGNTDETDPAADPYHPAGWEDPTVHGLAAKLQEQDCVACHGADLSGGTAAVACDACHAPGWQTACTYCHGGVENGTGAPPENIDDSVAATDLPDFPVHSSHVEETIHAAFDCAECHAKPTDALTPGHVLVGDATPGEAEVTIARGGTWQAGSCADLYCHGDGQGNNGSADASFVSSCHACHPDWTSPEGDIAAMSGQHELHVAGKGLDCSECHAKTVDADHGIVDPKVHVDGAPTFDNAGITFDAATDTCTGTCHGEGHSGRSW